MGSMPEKYLGSRRNESSLDVGNRQPVPSRDSVEQYSAALFQSRVSLTEDRCHVRRVIVSTAVSCVTVNTQPRLPKPEPAVPGGQLHVNNRPIRVRLHVALGEREHPPLSIAHWPQPPGHSSPQLPGVMPSPEPLSRHLQTGEPAASTVQAALNVQVAAPHGPPGVAPALPAPPPVLPLTPPAGALAPAPGVPRTIPASPLTAAAPDPPAVPPSAADALFIAILGFACEAEVFTFSTPPPPSTAVVGADFADTLFDFDSVDSSSFEAAPSRGSRCTQMPSIVTVPAGHGGTLEHPTTSAHAIASAARNQRCLTFMPRAASPMHRSYQRSQRVTSARGSTRSVPRARKTSFDSTIQRTQRTKLSVDFARLESLTRLASNEIAIAVPKPSSPVQ